MKKLEVHDNVLIWQKEKETTDRMVVIRENNWIVLTEFNWDDFKDDWKHADMISSGRINKIEKLN